MSAYREESQVRVSYRLEPEDLEREWEPQTNERVRLVRLMLAGVAAVAGAVFIFTLPRGIAHAALVAGALGAFWLGRKMTTRNDAVKAYGDAWEDRRHVYLEVNEQELVLGDRLSEVRLAWDMVLHWRETEASFLVYPVPEQFRVIPKRALSSTEQLTTLRQLLTDRVREGGEVEIAAVGRTSWLPWAGYYVGFALLLLSLVEGLARVVASVAS